MNRNAVQVTAKLYEMQEAAKRLLGNRYDAQVEKYRQMVRDVADNKHTDHLHAGMAMMKVAADAPNPGITMMLVGAAIVDVIEGHEVEA